MKRLYFLYFLIAFSNLTSAQLSVRNSAYVFVNDEIVFVENDVNLNEATSTIYLRNQGQLIQGAGTETAATKNSGIGELSVYQDGNVGAHEYNYWCSPIASKTSSTVNNPFGISFLNDITGLTTATPATSTTSAYLNGTANPLNIEPYWIWKFIASDEYSEWVHVLNATSLNPGEGFTMKGVTGTSANNPGDNQNYDFRGKPNTGTIDVAVLTNQFTLVGNPYPSAMDAHAYIWDTDNRNTITGTLHFWEQDPNVNSHRILDYSGGYATYTIEEFSPFMETYTPATFSTYDLGGNINGAGSGSPSGKQPQRYIPIGQGFMVEGSANGTVKAKNAHRVYIKETNVDSEFFKTANTKEKAKTANSDFFEIHSDYKRFRLNIDFNNTYTRQLLENFHAKATFGFDRGLESKINAADILATDAYFSNDNATYLAEALPFDEALKIPLTIKLAQNMPIRIRITDIRNFDSNQPVYIHDKENDLYVNLKVQDFDMNLEAGNYNDRFEVTFNNKALSVDDNTFIGFDIFQNNTIAELKIKNPNALDIKAFNLFDISGKQILNQNISEIKNTYSFSTKALSDGVYIARISLSNNQGFTKKIIVANKN